MFVSLAQMDKYIISFASSKHGDAGSNPGLGIRVFKAGAWSTRGFDSWPWHSSPQGLELGARVGSIPAWSTCLTRPNKPTCKAPADASHHQLKNESACEILVISSGKTEMLALSSRLFLRLKLRWKGLIKPVISMLFCLAFRDFLRDFFVFKCNLVLTTEYCFSWA
jgi:hypothetical protein